MDEGRGKFTGVRTPIESPFTPGSDVVPPVWAGRTTYLSDWRDIVRPRRLSGVYERGRTLLGEAGTGKSSLVRRIAADAEDAGDWVTPQLRVPLDTDPLSLVASALLELADRAGLPHARDKRIGDQLARVEQVAAGPVSMKLRESAAHESYKVLSELLVEIAREAARLGETMVVVHIDEVQNITDEAALSQLLVALGDALSYEDTVTAPGSVRFRRVLPLAVYLTGLGEFEEMTSRQRGATFSRRFQTSILTGLGDGDMTAALQPFVTEGWETTGPGGDIERVFMTPEARDAIVGLAMGEPLLFQLAGERAWYAGVGDVITADEVHAGWDGAKSEARRHVERILNRLPARERTFLEAMSAIAPEERSLSRITASMGYESGAGAGSAAQRLDSTRGLIARGKNYTFRHRAVEAYLTSPWPDVGD